MRGRASTENPGLTLAVSAGAAFVIEAVLLCQLGRPPNRAFEHQPLSATPTTHFIQAEVFKVPPQYAAKLFSKAAPARTASSRPEPVLSKVANQGRAAKTAAEKQITEANQTVAASPTVPLTHGPIALSSPTPVLPTRLKDSELQASVVIEFLISSTGVVNPRLLSSSDNEELDQIALASARQWKFQPAEENGKKIDSKIRLRINFEVK